MTAEEEELEHIDHILRSFTSYRYQHLAANNLRRQAFANLRTHQQELLPNQKDLLLVRFLPSRLGLEAR